MPLKSRGPIVPAADPVQNGASHTLPAEEAPVPPEMTETVPAPPEPVDIAPGPSGPPTERPVRTLDPSLVPGTATKRGFVPKGHIERVECLVYPDMPMQVSFNTSIGYRVLRDNYYGPGETPVERECRRLLLIVSEFEGWNAIDPLDGTAIPAPDPRNWETYRPIVQSSGLLSDLYVWIVSDGLTRALRQAAGNS